MVLGVFVSEDTSNNTSKVCPHNENENFKYNPHPPNLLLFSLHVKRQVAMVMLLSQLKPTRKSQVFLTRAGKMANTENSIRH